MDKNLFPILTYYREGHLPDRGMYIENPDEEEKKLQTSEYTKESDDE
jgi:hypothetical protein